MENKIQIIQDKELVDFLSVASGPLYQHESLNSLMLGLCEGMLRLPPKNDPLLLRLMQGEKLLSVAVQTPPMNLILTHATPSTLEALAQFCFERNCKFPGVVGPAAECDFFSDLWSKRTGEVRRLGMGQKIYQLTKVQAPDVKGALQLVDSSHEDLMCFWMQQFSKESLPPFEQRDEEYWREFSQRAIKNQNAHFWMHKGRPVSIALASRPTQNGVSINGVFTPEEYRRQGFASAVVAHLSQKKLDEGKKFCVLYTDLANPTSNKIYQRIGYQEVADSKYYLFGG